MKSGVIHIHQNVKCLFTLQKKAIRQICNADILAHTNAMFKDMSILKLSEFVKYKTAIMMFNLFHGTLPIQVQRRFTKYSSVHSTRQNKSFVMVRVRTNIKAMCLSVYGVKLWNTLPDDIKNCTSVNILNKCLKNISYHTIRLIHCNKLIIRTTLFAIDQSKIMVKYMASNCAYNSDRGLCVWLKAIISLIGNTSSIWYCLLYNCLSRFIYLLVAIFCLPSDTVSSICRLL